MAKERKYMYLEKTMMRVPIRAKGGIYAWKIGNATCEISAAIERLLIYAVYIGHPRYNFFELARLNLPKKVVANTNPELIRTTFTEDHPLIELIEYDTSMIPEYADSAEGMWLDGDGKKWSFWITTEDERRLLLRLKENKPWSSCMAYIRSVAMRYAMNYDDGMLSDALVSFLIQHGVEPDTLKKKDKEYERKKNAEKEKVNSSSLADTRDYARKEWLKYHPEDRTAKNGSYQRKTSDDGSGFVGILGIMLALAIIVVWVLMFTKTIASAAALPILTFAMMGAYDIYWTKNKEFDGLCTFFLVFLIINLITSFVGLGLSWEWDYMDNEMGSGINIFVPAVYAMVRGGSIGT